MTDVTAWWIHMTRLFGHVGDEISDSFRSTQSIAKDSTAFEGVGRYAETTLSEYATRRASGTVKSRPYSDQHVCLQLVAEGKMSPVRF